MVYRYRKRKYVRRRTLRSRRSRYRKRPASRRRTSYRRATVRLGRTRWTLKKRVKVLEGPTKKHFDMCDITGGSNLPRSYTVAWNGCSYDLQPDNAGDVIPLMLNIQPRTQIATIPGFSAQFPATELNTRVNNSVYVKNIKVTGRLEAPYTRPEIDISAVPANIFVANPNMMAITSCKIWLVLLRDTRASETDAQGDMVGIPDTLNDQQVAGVNQNLGPLEQQFLSMGADPATTANKNTLQQYGLEGALKSYQKTRYKVVFKKRFVLSASKPFVDFTLDLKIGKKLDYAPQRPGGVSIASAPLHNRFILTACTSWVDNVEENPDADTNFPPVLTNLRSRAYFRDC